MVLLIGPDVLPYHRWDNEVYNDCVAGLRHCTYRPSGHARDGPPQKPPEALLRKTEREELPFREPEREKLPSRELEKEELPSHEPEKEQLLSREPERGEQPS
ncbi:UNVERIFIED_CONTAM: hypothetical protein FKN15_040096 [Acipenser sinensis]